MTNRKQTGTNKCGKVKAIKLAQEAFKLVEYRADEIVQCLMDSTRQGKVMSTRLLVDLAEGNVDLEEAQLVNPLRSLALRLAAEPQWQAPKPNGENEPKG